MILITSQQFWDLHQPARLVKGEDNLSKVAKVWFEEAKNLEIDEALFLRVANKAEQTELANQLEKLRDTYSSLNSIHASQLFVNKVLKNRKQYVVIERKYRTPYTAFLKSKDDGLVKITIDPERKRQIYLMIQDGKTRDEVEDALNGLTDREIKEFYTEEK